MIVLFYFHLGKGAQSPQTPKYSGAVGVGYGHEWQTSVRLYRIREWL